LFIALTGAAEVAWLPSLGVEDVPAFLPQPENAKAAKKGRNSPVK